ncbi:hypothetical protein GCM10025876_01120 [Demequina litorisediminis]|uniref:Transketolase-like pyrimidine-binding domain-containing protein n=1 Tax=Demequina litorisediminis TaxID=1849022 RepID=A0ABQ6I7U0_9MICO|nr:hypothetical protein GCM10025876_01120 [Demequina litorisediminis]
MENSHASTAVSWAAGIGRGYALRGETDRTAVAVIGDGALTGGMAWEALNSVAASRDRVVIVVNDNGRSYAPTIGGLARRLDGIRTDPRYEQFLGWGKRNFQGRGWARNFTYQTVMHGKRAVKGLITEPGMFEDLGLKYVGPVDGHDLAQVEAALTHAKSFGGPVIVHVLTEKGRGYTPAEEDVADRFHAVGVIHPETGLPVKPSRFGWTSVFAEEIVAVARERDDVVALTAAMLAPVGLQPMADEFPDRVIDVGIAEQHAVTSAAGLAFAGMHPVFAVYATFLNRAFDQVLMDVALHGAGVTFMLDRAGITGDDGPSHNGMWDMALLRHVPGLRLAAPRDASTLRQAFREAVDVDDAPTVVRYPKGPVGEDLPALRSVGDLDVLAEHSSQPRVVVLGLGSMATTAIDTAAKIAAEGVGVVAATATWVHPVPDGLDALIGDAEAHRDRRGRPRGCGPGPGMGGVRPDAGSDGLVEPSRRAARVPRACVAGADRGAGGPRRVGARRCGDRRARLTDLSPPRRFRFRLAPGRYACAACDGSGDPMSHSRHTSHISGPNGRDYEGFAGASSTADASASANASASRGAVRSICHWRASRDARRARISSSPPPRCSQQARRIASGCRRFSAGISSRSARAPMRGRATSRRAAASGRLSFHMRG